MSLPMAYELHVARELVVAGGSTVALGGFLGGLYGALNPEQEGWEASARSGVMWGCVVAFFVVLALANG